MYLGRKQVLTAATVTLLISCSTNSIKDGADAFLEDYSEKLQKFYYATAEAQWLANTDITPEHDSLSVLTEKEYAAFVGSKEVIQRTRSLLSQKDELDPLQVRQLNKIMLAAAHRPGTIPAVTNELINAETKQNSLLYGFDFTLPQKDGTHRKVSTNEIDNILVKSMHVQKRLAAWETSKEVGKILKDGLADLQSLRNQVAREMGYSSFFDLEVADYGMTAQEMIDLMQELVRQLRPLYSQLHTYARYELAKRYNQPVPEKIPAHWLPNRWGQNWPGIVEAVNLDNFFKDKTKEWIVEQSETFYMSIGFPQMKQNFWEKSDLYPVPASSARKKNNHASAWHLNLQDDYRSLMSVEPNSRWFGTSHHERGHIYYYIEYSTPDVPLVLREGANRSYHEGIGELMKLASSRASVAAFSLSCISPPDTSSFPGRWPQRFACT